MKKTGSGTPGQETSQITPRIASMIPGQINSLNNPFDDDATTKDDEMMSDHNANESDMSTDDDDTGSYILKGKFE
jgi:hypothetical protein